MSSLKLNSVKTSLLSKSHALSELVFGFFNLFKSHLMRYGCLLTSKISHFLTATDCRWCPNLKSLGFLAVSCSTCVINLNKNSAIVGMDSVCHFFPTLGLFLSVKVSRSGGWPSSLTPGHCLSENNRSTRPLSIVFSHHFIRNTTISTSLTS